MNGTTPKQIEAAALAPINVGERGLQLTTMDDMWRFAGAVVKSGMAPPGMDKPETIFIAIAMGAELGLPPMTSVRSIAVINRRPSVWGDVMLALCRAHPVFDEAVWREEYQGEGDDFTAYCACGRIGGAKKTLQWFSIADAKKAGLWGKQGPWTTNPRRMLQMRARSFALRDTFPDLLQGIYTREEAMDIPVDRVTVADDPTLIDTARAAVKRLREPPSDTEPPKPEPAPELLAEEHLPTQTTSPDQPPRATPDSGGEPPDDEPLGGSTQPHDDGVIVVSLRGLSLADIGETHTVEGTITALGHADKASKRPAQLLLDDGTHKMKINSFDKPSWLKYGIRVRCHDVVVGEYKDEKQYVAKKLELIQEQQDDGD